MVPSDSVTLLGAGSMLGTRRPTPLLDRPGGGDGGGAYPVKNEADNFLRLDRAGPLCTSRSLEAAGALAPDALQRWSVLKEFHMSKVVKVRAAIAANGSAVPTHLDFMGSDAGNRACTAGHVAAVADPDNAVT